MRAADERGAVIVELAFVAILLLTLTAGAYDYGIGWRVGLATTESARTGARVGSAQGATVGADYALLTGSRAALASSGLLGRVTRVVVYRSTTADGDVPAVCKTTSSGTPGQPCNILTGAQFRAIPATPVAGTLDSKGCIAASLARGWCPTDRNATQLNADFLGVWVQVSYTFQFRLIGSSMTVERDAVMRLEPAGG